MAGVTRQVSLPITTIIGSESLTPYSHHVPIQYLA